MKILLFAPHSALWVHAFPEALIAEALQQAGHEIQYISCGRQLETFCVAMSAHALTPFSSAEKKRAVCDRCTSNDTILRANFGFSGPRLSELKDPGDEPIADEMIAQFAQNPILLEHDGLPLGRLALYEFMLRKKKIDLFFDANSMHEFKTDLRNAILVSLAGRRLLDVHRPDRLIVYNSLYSVNRVMCELARQREIPCYFLHAGGNLSNRLQTLMFGSDSTLHFFKHVVGQWKRFSNVPISPRILSLVTAHYEELFTGRNVFAYSKAKANKVVSMREHFGVGDDQSLIVAALSSPDEEVAADSSGANLPRDPLLFPSQVEWINTLLEFVRGRPDLYLVIRVHPREFPNKRESVLSEHAQLLRDVLNDLPPNAAVNWPTDEISLYDFASETDVFLTSWSSVGREMPILGIPVVAYAPQITFYPSDLNYVAKSVTDYLRAIDLALADGWSFERARTAYRWGAMEFGHSLLFIDDSYLQREQINYSNVSLAQRILDKTRRTLDPAFRLKDDCRKRAPRLAAGDTVVRIIEEKAESVLDLLDPATIEQGTLEEESSALRHELKRLADALYPAKEARDANRLYQKLTGDFGSRG